jgi:hypothetical protein
MARRSGKEIEIERARLSPLFEVQQGLNALGVRGIIFRNTQICYCFYAYDDIFDINSYLDKALLPCFLLKYFSFERLISGKTFFAGMIELLNLFLNLKCGW